jgi:hypothetical protein
MGGMTECMVGVKECMVSGGPFTEPTGLPSCAFSNVAQFMVATVREETSERHSIESHAGHGFKPTNTMNPNRMGESQ